MSVRVYLAGDAHERVSVCTASAQIPDRDEPKR